MTTDVSKVVLEILKNLPSFSGKREDYPDWIFMVKALCGYDCMGDIISTSQHPACNMNSENEEKLVREKMEVYLSVMSFMRMKLMTALTPELIRLVRELKGYRVDVMFRRVGGEAERVNRLKARFTKVTRDGIDYVDGTLPHLYDIMELVERKMTAQTGGEKSLLMSSLYQMRMDEKKEFYDDFVARVKARRREVEAAGMTVDDELYKCVITSNLPSHFSGVLSTVETQPGVTLEQIESQLATHARNWRIREGKEEAEKKVTTGEPQDARVLFASARGTRDGTGGGFRGRGRGTRGRGRGHYNRGGHMRTCYNCHKPGHLAKDCRAAAGNHVSYQRAQQEPDRHQMSRLPKCFNCGKLGHIAKFCVWKKGYEAHMAHVNTQHVGATQVGAEETMELMLHVGCMTTPDPPDSMLKIQLDSGADEPITNDMKLYDAGTLVKLDQPATIGGVEGTRKLIADHKGSVTLCCDVNGRPVNRTFHNVLYVPSFKGGTILSLGAWTRRGCRVVQEGVMGDVCGRTYVTLKDKLMVTGTQRPHSSRTYLDLYGQGNVAHRKPGSSLLLQTDDGLHNMSVYNQDGVHNSCETAGHDSQCNDQRVVRGAMDGILLLHEKIGHQGAEVVRHFLSDRGTLGRVSTEQIREAIGQCHACKLGKLKNHPHTKVCDASSYAPGELLSLDTFGPSQVASRGGSRYFSLLVDRRTRMLWCALARTKDAVATQMLEHVKRLRVCDGVNVRRLRYDNAGEFVMLDNYCKEAGLRIERTVPGESQQNGQVERFIGIITAMARTIRIAAGAPISFWAEAVMHAVWLYVRSPHACLEWQSPIVMFYPRAQIDQSKFVPWGCAAYYRRKIGGQKMDAQGAYGVFVGYDTMRDGARVWDPIMRKCMVAWSVEFNVRRFPWLEQRKTSDDPSLLYDDRAVPTPRTELPAVEQAAPPSASSASVSANSSSSVSSVPAGAESESKGSPPPAQLDHAYVPAHNTYTPTNTEPLLSMSEPSPSSSLPEAKCIDDVGSEIGRAAGDQNSTRGSEAKDSVAARVRDRSSGRASKTTDTYEPVDFRLPRDFRVKQIETMVAPTSYEEAIQSPCADSWRAAMKAELESLRTFKTYSVVDSVPIGHELLPSRWVFAIKRDEKGNVVKYKARIVARGDRQFCDDSLRTRADVAETRSFRFIVCLRSVYGGVLFQGDVKSAYLQCTLDQVVFLRAPPGAGDQVWRLHKCLYGLRQAGRQWRRTFDVSLRKCGFTPSEADPGVYFLFVQGRLTSALCLHVDDFFGWAMDGEVSQNVCDGIAKHHTITTTMNPTLMLHTQVKRGSGDSVLLSQEQFICDLVEEWKGPLGHIVPSRVPIEKGKYLQPAENESELLNESGKKAYQAVVGSLNYLSCNSRPDICFVVNQLSMFMQSPSVSHFALLSKVLGYLYRTRSACLCYSGAERKECKLIGYSDANFPPTKDARATCGMIWGLVVDGRFNPLSWSSKKLGHVCLSTPEAELAAGSIASLEGIALRKLMIEAKMIRTDETVDLYVDNKAAVDIAKDGGYYPKLKHVNRRHKFLVEAQAEHMISVKWCEGGVMLADPLTKALGGPELEAFRSKVFAC